MNDYNDGIIPEPCLRLDYGVGQEYASVELGDGTGYVRVTDELRGEYHKMQRWYEDVLKAALDENAKLRELVADMWFWHYEGHIDSESQERQMLHIDAVIQRMRELGVKADG